jgi:hypothetical protein
MKQEYLDLVSKGDIICYCTFNVNILKINYSIF